MKQAILFDLDGTLLPMDLDRFTNGYLGLLTKTMSRYGYDPDRLAGAIWSGVKKMTCNDGSVSGEQCFWAEASKILGAECVKDIPLFDQFYRNEYRQVKQFTEPVPSLAIDAVRAARECAGKVALATNPLFPLCAVEERLSWIGLSTADFDLVTSYENSYFCKPQTGYYASVLAQLNASPENCLMIGNDVDEDILPAQSLGMRTILVTDCMRNHKNQTYASEESSFSCLSDAIRANCLSE